MLALLSAGSIAAAVAPCCGFATFSQFASWLCGACSLRVDCDLLRNEAQKKLKGDEESAPRKKKAVRAAASAATAT